MALGPWGLINHRHTGWDCLIGLLVTGSGRPIIRRLRRPGQGGCLVLLGRVLLPGRPVTSLFHRWSLQSIVWGMEDTFTTYEIQTWLADIILGMDRFRNLTAWPVWVEVTGYIGNKTKISSLSIDRQLKFQLTAWQKWEIKLYKMGISSQSTQAVISLQWRCLRACN